MNGRYAENTEKYLQTKGYGTWAVTTEGDCEGRSVKKLGVFRGRIDEIALFLGNQAYYSLRFELVDTSFSDYVDNATSVDVSFVINSDTWDMTREERLKFMKAMMPDSKYVFSDGSTYASVKISVEDEAAVRARIKRQQALAKLTAEERKLLGLE